MFKLHMRLKATVCAVLTGGARTVIGIRLIRLLAIAATLIAVAAAPVPGSHQPDCRHPRAFQPVTGGDQMAAQILHRASAIRRRADAASIAARLGAAAFAAAAAWYTLAARGVTVAAAPRLGAHVPLVRREHIYYRWLVTTLPQERFYTAIAIAGFLCLAAVAAFARDWLGRDRTAATTGSFLAAAGAAAWIAGSLIQLGGHRAVGLMATHANPIQATNSISFTVDMTSQAFSLAAFTLLAAGMLAFARAAAQTRPHHRAWAAYTALLAALMLLTAWSYAAGNGNLTDLLLLAGGVALLPGWLIWTGRTIPAHRHRAASEEDGNDYDGRRPVQHRLLDGNNQNLGRLPAVSEPNAEPARRAGRASRAGRRCPRAAAAPATERLGKDALPEEPIGGKPDQLP